MNLVAGVVATGAAGGSATGIVLTYVVGGSTYQLTTGSGVTVRVAPQQC